jgi:hypothetical protein
MATSTKRSWLFLCPPVSEEADGTLTLLDVSEDITGDRSAARGVYLALWGPRTTAPTPPTSKPSAT